MIPECTIVIPTYNNETGCRELIADIHRLHPGVFHVTVVDQMGLAFGAEVDTHIRVEGNIGFSRAQNLGWSQATTPYVLLANDDVRLLDPRWYTRAKDLLTGAVLAVNPFPALRTWDENGTPQWYWSFNDQFAWTKDKPLDSYTPEEYDRLNDLNGHGVGPGATTFFLLAKTEMRDIVGMFDENFPNNNSDYDLNRRTFLTCRHCGRRKYEHLDGHVFDPYLIVTSFDSLVHHHCGVTKEGMNQTGQRIAGDKDMWVKKWGAGADIYGQEGLLKPHLPWVTYEH